MTRLRGLLAGAVLAALAAPSAVLMSAAAVEPAPSYASERRVGDDPTTTAPTTTATATATPSSEGPLTVDDAQLRWGINDESNNAAFAPGTFNILSAGEVKNPGAGGQRLALGGGGTTWTNGRPAGWAARSGGVRIEKRRADGGYALATFDGTSTDASGTRLTTSGGTFSDHQVVIDGGTGTVDPAAGRATISWDGTFTVLYYSGMTFFMVSDPELVVTPTTARLTASLGGYASDMADQTKWVRVPAQQVVLADLPRASIDLPVEGGFSVDPAYRQVRYDAPSDGVTQVRDGDSWGAFPTSFLSAMQRLGAAAYWYSSGGSADVHKVPKTLTVSYSADDPVEVPADPDPTDDASDDPTATPTQSVAPSPPPPPTPTPPAQPGGPALPTQPAAVVPTGAVPQVVSAPLTYDPRLPSVPVVTAQTAPAASRADTSGHPWEWWTGSVLLLGAAVITTIGRLGGRRKGTS